MILLFKLIAILTIWCLGVTILTQKDMVLYSLRERAEKKESIWYMPLILCPWCLPSIHSLIGYSFAIAIGVIDSFSWQLIFMWPLVVMGASVATGIIWSIYKLIEIKTQHFSNIEQLSFFDLEEKESNRPKNGIH